MFSIVAGLRTEANYNQYHTQHLVAVLSLESNNQKKNKKRKEYDSLFGFWKDHLRFHSLWYYTITIILNCEYYLHLY